MEQLSPKQMEIANVLIDYARAHASGPATDLLMDEAELATRIGDNSWKRATNDDLIALAAFCNRENYPLVPLMVVIPGLNKPEKTLMTKAFHATLSPAENTKRWDAALSAIQQTPVATWDEFQARMQPPEE